MSAPNGENPDNGFDGDIEAAFGNQEGHLINVFVELHEAFLSMVEAGFTDSQALRYLAFCSLYASDYDEDNGE